MFSSTRGFVACVTLFLCASLIPLHAQKVTSTIRGTVTDPTGAAISGAEVTVRNTDTNATRTAKSGDTGEYVVPELDAGTYEVGIKQANFKEFVTKNVQLFVSSTQVVNATLQVGSTSEQVTVEANPVQVETSTGAVGNVVEGNEVRELPLNGRSFVQLTQLMPGVSPQANFDSKNKGLLAGVDFSVNGNNTTGNIFMVDGVNNNDIGSNRTILVYPSIDAIQEFKILRNSYGPEYGQAMGAIINIITRGGTNQFHGSAFYEGRNDVLNATDYFNTLNGAPKDVLRRNDWGYTIGGPIKKDKLFFFWSQEWNHELRGAERDANVPTVAEKGVFDRSTDTFTTAPDFSQLRMAQDGSPCERTPTVSGSPATAIPGGQFSTAGALLLQLFPDPNLPQSSVLPDLCNNWGVSITAPIYWREENIRVDYNLTNTWHIMGRYTHDSWSQPYPSTLGFWGDDIYPSVESSWIQPGVQATVKITKDFGTAVNDFQISFAGNRITASRAGSDPGLNNLITAALPPDFPLSGKTSGADMGYPVFWGGLGNGADSSDLWTQAPWHNNEQLFIFKDDYSKVVGSHTLKFGFLASNNQKNELVNGSSGEAPNFGGLGAGSVDTTNGAFNALWNQVIWNASELQTNPFGQQRWHDYEFYYGDTWKIRNNLTLEYGFRWSFLRQPFVSDNRIASFQPSAYDPSLGSDACNGLILVPGTNFCQAAGFLGGVPGPNRALKNNDNHTVAPRIGIAWDPKGDGKMSLRAGVGQFFQRERLSNGLSMANNSPFSLSVPSIDRQLDVAIPQTGGSGAPNFGVDPGQDLPNTWQWNLTFEREVYRDSKIEIAYVGNRGIHLLRYNDANFVPQSLWQEYATNAVLQSNNPGDPDTFTSTNNGLRKFGRTPGCDPLVEGDCGSFGQLAYAEWKGNSNYHALQALFRTRLKSLDAQFAYTFSKSLSDTSLTSSGTTGASTVLLNPVNPRLNYGPSYINRPHTLVGEVVYTLPDLSGHSMLMRHAAGGWELAGILDYASGTSLTMFANGNVSGNPGGLTGTGALADATRPNRVAGQPCHAPGSAKFQWLNPNAWTINSYQLGTFGNAGVGECLGPGLANTDFSVHKNFKAGERVNLQFRLDFFNLFNKVQFKGNSEDITGIDTNLIDTGYACTAVAQNAPDTSAQFATSCPNGVTNRVAWDFANNGNVAFGQVQHDKGPREIQYSLKIEF
jgi:Carboxypeptidase regulatory-like domain